MSRTNGFFNRAQRLQALRQREWCNSFIVFWPIRFVYLADYPEDSILILMELIELEQAEYHRDDQHTNRHAHSQSEDIDNSK